MAKAAQAGNASKSRRKRTVQEQRSSTTLTLLRQSIREATQLVGDGKPIPAAVCVAMQKLSGEINAWIAGAESDSDHSRPAEDAA